LRRLRNDSRTASCCIDRANGALNGEIEVAFSAMKAPRRRTYGGPTTSAPSRAPNARQMTTSTSSTTHCRLPSTHAMLTPPLCQLVSVVAPPSSLNAAPKLPPGASRAHLRLFGASTWLYRDTA